MSMRVRERERMFVCAYVFLYVVERMLTQTSVLFQRIKNKGRKRERRYERKEEERMIEYARSKKSNEEEEDELLGATIGG